MADGENDVLDLDDEVIENDDLEGEAEEQDEAESEVAAESDELEVEFEDDAAPASGGNDSALIKHLRDVNRRQAEELAKVRKGGVSEEIVVGPKPDLYDDCEGDPDKFEKAYDEWKERKAKADAQQAEAGQAQEAIQKQWQADLLSFREKEAMLKAPDMDVSKDVVASALSEAQQATIIKAAANPALVIYALGKNPAKLAALSEQSDLIKLAAEIARIEGKITVAKKQSAPPVEKVSEGSGQFAAGDKKLAALEAKAAKTGDRTELIRYRKQRAANG